MNPGFGGQKLIPATLDKVRRLRALLDARSLGVPIQVDGGINAGTVAAAVRAGADVLVVGAAVFAAPEGIAGAIRQLRSLATEAVS